MKKRLGELLLEKQLIDVNQLTAALAHQRQWGIRLGAALVANGFIAEGTLMQVLSDALGLPMVDLSKVVIDKNALMLVPVRVCEQYEVFPIAIREPKGGRRTLLLAMADPLNVTAVDEVSFLSDCIIKVGIAQATSIDQAIQRHHRGRKIEIAPMNFERPTPRSPSQTNMQGVGGRAPSRTGLRPVGEVTATGAGPRPLPNNDFVDESSDPGRPVLLGRPAQKPTTTQTGSSSPPPSSLVASSSVASSSPLMAQSTDPFSFEGYDGQPTGVFAMPSAPSPSTSSPPSMLAEPVPSQSPTNDREMLEALERKFWALMRVLHSRGQITREEFVAELGEEI